jgi:hypothetical protein
MLLHASARSARTGRDATSARIHKEFAMSAALDDRFTMPDDVPFTMPGDSVFATEDPDELLGRLWVAGMLDENTLPPERKSALAAWQRKLLARTARETGARVVEADAAEAPASSAASADQPVAAPKKERNTNGTFAKGNPGGPGNPFGRRVAALRSKLLSCITDEDMTVATAQLIKLVRDGDLAALKLFYQYSVGKPAATVDPDRVDIDEANLLESARQGVDLAKNLIRTPPLETMLGIIHIMQEVCQGMVLADVKQSVDNGNRKDALRAQRAAKAAERREKRRAAVTQRHQTANGAPPNGEPPGVIPRVGGDTPEMDSQSGAAKEVASTPAQVEAPMVAEGSADVAGATTHPAANAARLAEPVAPPATPPSTNGRNGHHRPSRKARVARPEQDAKGVGSDPRPSKTPGVPPGAPSTNGDNGNVGPSTKGPSRPNGDAPPSTNGPNDDAAPSPNGNKRRPGVNHG